MKKFLALMLTALMFLSITIPAMAEDAPIVLPVLRNLLDAPIVDMELAEDGASMYYDYAPVTEEHLYYYLTLAAMVGTYAMEADMDDSTDIWNILVSPGSPSMGMVVYSPENKALYVQAEGSVIPMQDDDAQGIYDYLAQGFTYPKGTSGYVFPEFSALAGKRPAGQNTVDKADHIFGGKKTYFETYRDIDYKVIEQYTQFMMRYGFEPTLDEYGTDYGYVDPVWIHFTNDEMEVILYYSVTDRVAQVYTKPGMLPYILNAQQILESFGQ